MSASRHDTSEYGLPRPDSKDENARLEIQHHLWLNTLNGLYLAPISPPVNNVNNTNQSFHVLDVGCGPGSWTRDFALKHPASHVVGLDLNPPSSSAMPSNTSFVKGNAEDQAVLKSAIPSGSQGFSFIFGRCLTMGIHSWPDHLGRCFSLLAPGGWLESEETTLRFETTDIVNSRTESPVCRWSDRLSAGTRALGFDPELAVPGRLAHGFEKAGFVNISERTDIWWPFGGSETFPWGTKWEREMAEYGREDFYAFFRATTERVLPAAEGFSPEEAKALLSEVWEEVTGTRARRYKVGFAVRVGQKPAGGKT